MLMFGNVNKKLFIIVAISFSFVLIESFSSEMMFSEYESHLRK